MSKMYGKCECAGCDNFAMLSVAADAGNREVRRICREHYLKFTASHIGAVSHETRGTANVTKDIVTRIEYPFTNETPTAVSWMVQKRGYDKAVKRWHTPEYLSLKAPIRNAAQIERYINSGDLTLYSDRVNIVFKSEAAGVVECRMSFKYEAGKLADGIRQAEADFCAAIGIGQRSALYTGTRKEG